MVPAYTDLKLHDISATSGAATDPECEPLDQNQPAGSPGFFHKYPHKHWGFVAEACESRTLTLKS